MGQNNALLENSVYDEHIWINPVTGEVKYEEERRPRDTSKLFVKVYRIEHRKMLKQLRGNNLLVFDYVIDYFDTATNHIKITSRALAKELDISDSSVTRAFKLLKELNIVRIVKYGEWMLNPYIAMYGDFKIKLRRLYAEYIEYK